MARGLKAGFRLDLSRWRCLSTRLITASRLAGCVSVHRDLDHLKPPLHLQPSNAWFTASLLRLTLQVMALSADQNSRANHVAVQALQAVMPSMCWTYQGTPGPAFVRYLPCQALQ